MSEAMPIFKSVELPHRAAEGMYQSRQCRYGFMKWLTADHGIGALLREYAEYSEGEVVLWRRIVKPGDTVVSAGGNIGAHLVPLSQLVGFHGRVITFEPQDECRALLEENLRVNGCTNVEVHADGLGAEHGHACLPTIDYTIPNNFGGMELREVGPLPVRVVPLDSLALERLDMLMLDVEGFELRALRGSHDTIMRLRPYLYVEIDREEQREAILHYMKNDLGYEVLFHTPEIFNPKNFAGNPDNPWGPMRSIMCLGVPW